MAAFAAAVKRKPRGFSLLSEGVDNNDDDGGDGPGGPDGLLGLAV